MQAQICDPSLVSVRSSSGKNPTTTLHLTNGHKLQIVGTFPDSNDDRLKVLLKQEQHYSCPNYLSPTYHRHAAAVSRRAECLLEECAKLVTDLSLADNDPTTSTPPPMTKPKDVASPHDVARLRQKTNDQSSSPRLVVPTKAASKEMALTIWRSQMCSWVFTVVETYGYHRPIVATTFSLLDRFLAKQSSLQHISRQDYQLYTMTALFIAVKCTQSFDRLTLESLVDMSRGFFSPRDFEETELEMLLELDWQTCPPTCFLFLDLLAERFVLHHQPLHWKRTCRQLLEWTVSDSFYIATRPSQVAVAAMMLAGEQCYIPSDELQTFCDSIQNDVNVEDDDFVAIYERLRCSSC